MREALSALIGCAFSVLGIRRLEAYADPQNVASTRLLQGIGFIQEGLLRQRWIDAGEPHDLAVFGLLSDEYICGNTDTRE